uniref:Uncharacterized protein n=1 Tax=Arundo donax TaxID=35708 RepID=A0A0A8YA54_ARUDO
MMWVLDFVCLNLIDGVLCYGYLSLTGHGLRPLFNLLCHVK